MFTGCVSGTTFRPHIQFPVIAEFSGEINFAEVQRDKRRKIEGRKWASRKNRESSKTKQIRDVACKASKLSTAIRA